MTSNAAQSQPQKVKIPVLPAVYANAREAYVMSADGEVSKLSHAAAKRMIAGQPVLVCHAPYTATRLDLDSLPAFDILELFAFVHPATFTVPTPVGIARALGITIPESAEDYPFALMEAAGALLTDLQTDKWRGRADPVKIAGVMGQNGKGWVWTPYVFAAFGQVYDPKDVVVSRADLNVWKALPEWVEEAPPPPASHHPVTGEEARERLAGVLGSGAEQRTAQMDYTSAMTAAFRPRETDGHVNAVLAEAGTGVGKTLGTSPPPASGRKRTREPCGFPPTRKTCKSRLGRNLRASIRTRI